MFWRKKKEIQSIITQKSGIEIQHNGNTTFIEWDSINRLVGFKIDKYTIDEICLQIEFKNQSIIVTEEYTGWRELINKTLIHFPNINKNWEGTIAIPAFEKNETELFNSNQSQ